ncbi:hypothetical protein ACSSS7_000935 [Eimeria intestinalis]
MRTSQIPSSRASPAEVPAVVVVPLHRRSVSPPLFHHVAGLLAAAAVIFLIGMCVRKLVRGKAEGVARRLAGASGSGDTCEGGAVGGSGEEEVDLYQAPDGDSDDDEDDRPGQSPAAPARETKEKSMELLSAFCTLVDEGIAKLGEGNYPNLAISPAGRMLNDLVHALREQVAVETVAHERHGPSLPSSEREDWRQAIVRANATVESAFVVAGLEWYNDKPRQPGVPENMRLHLLLQRRYDNLRKKLHAFVKGYPERSESLKPALLVAKGIGNMALQELLMKQQVLEPQVLLNRLAQEKRQALQTLIQEAEAILRCQALELEEDEIPKIDSVLIYFIDKFTQAMPVIIRMYRDPSCCVDINALASWGLRYKKLYNALERRMALLQTHPLTMYEHDKRAGVRALAKGEPVLGRVQLIIDNEGTVVD